MSAQVSNVEFYVNCADVKIVGGNNTCKKPTTTTAITGIEHLLTNHHPGKEGETGKYTPLKPCFKPLSSLPRALRWYFTASAVQS